MKRLLQISFLLFAVTTSSAFAMSDLAIMGGLNMSKPSIGSSVASTGTGTSLAFGATIGGNANPFLNLEGGFFYSPRKFDVAGIEQKLTALEFPLMLRITALPFVSIAGGGYYAHIVDHHGATGLSNSEFGVGGSARLRVPVLPLIGLIADVRYLVQLNNLASDPATLKNRSLELFAGLGFSL